MTRLEVLEEVWEAWTDSEYGDHFEDWLNDQITLESEVEPESEEQIEQSYTDNRVATLYEFINNLGRSGYVDVRPVIREIAELLDIPEEAILQTPLHNAYD